MQPISVYPPGRYAVIGCKLKQNANEGCNSCARVVHLFYVFGMFYFTCDRSLTSTKRTLDPDTVNYY